jgi:hypothetical protein
LGNLRNAYQQTRASGPFKIRVHALPSPGRHDADVYLHPTWDQEDPTWFEDNDLAVFRLNIPLPVDGVSEYRRPIFVGSEDYLEDLEARRGFIKRIGFCGYGQGSRFHLKCGLASNAETRNGHIEIDGSRWIGATCRLKCGDDDGRKGSKFEPGDSGGPVLVLNRHLCTTGSGVTIDDNRAVAEMLARHGAVVGVVSGPEVKKLARRLIRLYFFSTATPLSIVTWFGIPASIELDSMAGGTFNQKAWIQSIQGTENLFLVSDDECKSKPSVPPKNRACPPGHRCCEPSLNGDGCLSCKPLAAQCD